MLISVYQLYKTGLDPSYTNVYDGYNSLSEYSTFLNSFPVKTDLIDVYPDGNNKSIKSIDGNTFLVVNLRSEEVLRKGYNYAKILYVYDDPDEGFQEQALYYFIIKVESLNDGNTTGKIPSCRLTLKYDAWANNYIDYISANDHFQHVIRGTINHKIAQPSPSKIGVIPFSDRYVMQPNSKSINKRIGSNILWLGLRLDRESVTVTNSDGTAVEPSGLDSQKYNYIFYYPLKYYGEDRQDDFTIYTSTFPVTCRGGSKTLQIPDYLLKSTSVLEAWVTFYGFSYNPSESNVTINGNAYMVSWEGVSAQMISSSSIQDFSESISIYESIFYQPPENKGFETLQHSEEGLNIYPIKGKSLKIGDTIVPLNYNGVANYNISIVRDNSLIPTISITGQLGSDEHITMLKKTLNSTSYKIALIKDSLEIYMRNNGNLIENKRLQASMGVAIGAARIASGALSHNLGGIISGVDAGFSSIANGMAIDAQIKDADNALDQYSIPPVIGTDDPFIDGVYLIDESVRGEDTLIPYFYDIHSNGNYVDTAYPVSQNNKELFDYIQTTNCKLPNIPNFNFREEIEKAFDRGIRKFHITATNTEALINCESEYGNPMLT